MNVIIPESVKSYCANRGVRTAIDLLSEQGEDYLPDNLEWDELHSYYKSVLAAATVKTDFALFYLNLWDAIWKPALAAYGINEPWSIDEMRRDETPPSLKKIRKDGLYRVHYHPRDEGACIVTHLEVRRIAQQKIWIYISLRCLDGEGYPKEILLASEWQPSQLEFDGWYNTTEEAFPAIDPATIKEIDCTQMRKAAEQALRQLMWDE